MPLMWHPYFVYLCSSMQIVVKKIKTKADKEAAFRIRYNVFVIEQEVDASEEYDDDDVKSTHFISSADGIA